MKSKEIIFHFKKKNSTPLRKTNHSDYPHFKNHNLESKLNVNQSIRKEDVKNEHNLPIDQKLKNKQNLEVSPTFRQN